MELLKQNLAVENLSLLQNVAHERIHALVCLISRDQEKNVVHEGTHAHLCLNFLSSLVRSNQCQEVVLEIANTCPACPGFSLADSIIFF